MDNIFRRHIARSRMGLINPTSEVDYVGEEREMIKIEDAKLWMLGGRGHSRLVGVVKEGLFSICMVVQSLSCVKMTKCAVETIEWPLTLDTPVLRVGKRSFVFAMPGLVYGLELFPERDDILEPVAKILMKFGSYQDYSSENSGLRYFGSENESYFWPMSQWAIEHITEPIQKQLGAYWTRDEKWVYNMNERVLRVQHMSFFVKLISKGLLLGRFNTNVIAFRGWQMFEVKDGGDVTEAFASPTILLFSDFIEILEESLMRRKDPTYQVVAPFEPRWTTLPDVRLWSFNKRGIAVVLTLIKHAMHINFDVSINVILGQVIHNFFVQLKLDSNGKVEKVKKVPREIRFPILDGVGSTKWTK